jgi:hypothetical protein
MDEQDAWDRVGLTADWIAGRVATSLDREPTDLVWPTVVIGLFAGLGAEAVNATAGSADSLVLVGVTLTVCGFGMFGLLVNRVRRRRGAGGARTADLAILEPWLRRLQVLMAAVLGLVAILMTAGAASGVSGLVLRNLFEVGRIGAVVFAISFLLMDDEVGLPQWLTRFVRVEPVPVRN